MENIFVNATWGAVICLVLGLVACFWGYRLQKLWIALFAFGVGFVLVKNIVAQFTSYQGAIMGSAIVFACIIAGLSFNIYLVGLFLAAAGAAVWVSCQLIPNQWVGLFVGVLAGFFLGMLAVKANRPVVILLTGILGGLAAGKYLFGLLSGVPQAAFTAQYTWLPLVVGGVLAAAGVLVQFRTTTHAQPV